MLTDLAVVAKKTTFPVNEVPGWRTRGRASFPSSSVQSIMLHHTAAKHSASNPAPSLGVVTNGRSGLPGPLCQYLIDRNGVIHVVAAGVANHAGAVFKPEIYANNKSIGIEIEGPGFTDKQIDSAVQLCYYLVRHYRNINSSKKRLTSHKEACRPKGRKIDPSFNMNSFRKRVKNYRPPTAPTPVPTPAPAPAPAPAHKPVNQVKLENAYRAGLLNKWINKDEVRVLQKRVGATVDGCYGASTRNKVAIKQRYYNMETAYPGKLPENGRPTRATLRALGLQ